MLADIFVWSGLTSTADIETASARGSCTHDEPRGLNLRGDGTRSGKSTNTPGTVDYVYTSTL